MITSLRRAASAGLADVSAFLWPQRCPGCGEPIGGAADDRRDRALLCEACHPRIPRLMLPLCARCLAEEAAQPVCGGHAGFRVWAAWDYDERAAAVIEAFKYSGRTDLAGALAREISRALPPRRYDFVTEVPLHPARARERGYNQSALLARSVAAVLGVPHLTQVLRRVRATSTQARLGARARRANLRGAFERQAPGTLAGRAVLLVDDVMTTGATLEAALATLALDRAEAEAAVLAWAQ